MAVTAADPGGPFQARFARSRWRHSLRTAQPLFGNSGIGIILGPGQVNFDFSVLKVTPITEKQSVQFRAEFFNGFNHPQFDNPVTTQNTAGSTFGVIQSTATNPRIIQFALKYIF